MTATTVGPGKTAARPPEGSIPESTLRRAIAASALGAGIFHRRRIWRRGHLHGGICAGRPARLLRKLPRGGHPRRLFAGSVADARLLPVPRARCDARLGLAHPLLRCGTDGPGRHVPALEGGGDAGVPRGGGEGAEGTRHRGRTVRSRPPLLAAAARHGRDGRRPQRRQLYVAQLHADLSAAAAGPFDELGADRPGDRHAV